MKKIIQWIFLSSNDAEKLSTMIKGLAGFIPTAVLFLSFIHLNVEPGTLQALIDALVTTVTAIGALVSGFYVLYGAARKVYTSIVGTNDVVNTHF